MRAPDGKVTKWERDVLHTQMMTLIFEYLCRETEGGPDASRFLCCSSTLSGRELDDNGNPVFRTLERFHDHIRHQQFVEGMSSSEYCPTP